MEDFYGILNNGWSGIGIDVRCHGVDPNDVVPAFFKRHMAGQRSDSDERCLVFPDDFRVNVIKIQFIEHEKSLLL